MIDSGRKILKAGDIVTVTHEEVAPNVLCEVLSADPSQVGLNILVAVCEPDDSGHRHRIALHGSQVTKAEAK